MDGRKLLRQAIRDVEVDLNVRFECERFRFRLENIQLSRRFNEYHQQFLKLLSSGQINVTQLVYHEAGGELTYEQILTYIASRDELYEESGESDFIHRLVDEPADGTSHDDAIPMGDTQQRVRNILWSLSRYLIKKRTYLTCDYITSSKRTNRTVREYVQEWGKLVDVWENETIMPMLTEMLNIANMSMKHRGEIQDYVHYILRSLSDILFSREVIEEEEEEEEESLVYQLIFNGIRGRWENDRIGKIITYQLHRLRTEPVPLQRRGRSQPRIGESDRRHFAELVRNLHVRGFNEAVTLMRQVKSDREEMISYLERKHDESPISSSAQRVSSEELREYADRWARKPRVPAALRSSGAAAARGKSDKPWSCTLRF